MLVRHHRVWLCRIVSSWSPTKRAVHCGKPGSSSRSCREKPDVRIEYYPPASPGIVTQHLKFGAVRIDSSTVPLSTLSTFNPAPIPRPRLPHRRFLALLERRARDRSRVSKRDLRNPGCGRLNTLSGLIPRWTVPLAARRRVPRKGRSVWMARTRGNRRYSHPPAPTSQFSITSRPWPSLSWRPWPSCVRPWRPWLRLPWSCW